MNLKLKEIKFNDLGIVVNFFSYIVIYWYCFLTLIAIGKTISFGMASEVKYALLVNALSTMFNVHSSIIVIPLVLGVIMIFKRFFKIYYLALAILSSYFLNLYELIDNKIHPFLFNTGIYNFLLREGQQVLNPQYTKLLFFIVIITVLLVMVLFKKYRTIDRVFTTLIISIVLGTTIIFHFAIPMGMFKMAKQDFQKIAVYQMKYMSTEHLCENKHCYYFDNDFKLIKKSYLADADLIKKYQYYFNAVKNNQGQSIDGIYVDALGSFKGLRFDYIITTTKKTENGYLTVMDEKSMKYLSRSSELWFSFLASCAHFLWVFGGYSLLMLHKNKLIRRVNNVSE